MAVTVYKNCFTDQDLDVLLDYFYQQDDLVDDRFDVRSKMPVWNQTAWPQQVVEQKLKAVLDKPFTSDRTLFQSSKISFRVHVDTGTGHNRQYVNALIPMQFDGPSATVFFDNFWTGPSTRFARTNISPYRYNIPDVNGNFIWVDDIRQLLDQCINNPHTVVDFRVDKKFIEDLQRLIEVRHTADLRTSDYTEIINYRSETVFPVELHQQWLKHIPIEDLHGLTFAEVYHWQLGDLVIFDRTQLHCAAHGHKLKTGLSLFLSML